MDYLDSTRKALGFALDKYPERVEIAPVDQLLIDSARQNDRRLAVIGDIFQSQNAFNCLIKTWRRDRHRNHVRIDTAEKRADEFQTGRKHQ